MPKKKEIIFGQLILIKKSSLEAKICFLVFRFCLKKDEYQTQVSTQDEESHFVRFSSSFDWSKMEKSDSKFKRSSKLKHDLMT